MDRDGCWAGLILTIRRPGRCAVWLHIERLCPRVNALVVPVQEAGQPGEVEEL